MLHVLTQRPGRTGSGVTLQALVRRAQIAGWEQRVLCASSEGESPPEVSGLDQAQVTCVQFDSPNLPFAIPGMSDVMPYASRRFSSLSTEELARYTDAWRHHLRQVIAEFKPDVIHVHHVWLVASLVKELAGDTRVVIHCHGTGLRQRVLCPHLAPQVAAGCSEADAVLALHHQQRLDLLQVLKIGEQQIAVVGAGYRDDLFLAKSSTAREQDSIAYAGKYSAAKGLPWLLDAVERLNRRRPVTLHIAGTGTGPEADHLAHRMRGAPFVQLHGQLDQERLAELLRRSCVFALPSMFEGLPLVLVEAAASGCRVVSTDLPGVSSMSAALADRCETVAPPRLEGADVPLATDLPAFVDRLEAALSRSLQRGAAPPVPPEQLHDFTWSAVFGRVEKVWLGG